MAADKLSESTWTSFTKKLKLDLDDKALLKALAAFDKTDEAKHEPRLKALDEVVKQIPEQVKSLTKRKKEIGDKPFGEAKDKLYALLDTAETLQKETAKAQADAQAAAQRNEAKGGEGGEEEESPALLTTKMKPLLRELQKGEATMSALIALAGKETVVLVSRRAISPARGKLLKDQMEKPSGLKFIRADCLYEKNALTFVVQSPAAALAKRLRQALVDQTGLKFKVRVRGEDGAEEEDGEEGGDEPATATAQPGAAAPGASQPDQPGAVPDPAAAFKTRLAAVIAQVKEASAAGHPSALDAKLKASQAGVLATKKDFAAAGTLLGEAERLLATPAPATAGQAAAGEPGTAAKPAVDSAAAYTQRRDALSPRILAALGANQGDVSKIRALWAFAQEKADEKQDYPGAVQALGMIEKLLPAGAAAPAAAVEPPTEEPLALAPDFPLRWTKAKATWRGAMETVNGQLEALRGNLLGSADSDLGQIAEFGLNAITAGHKVPLDAALIDVDKAADDAKEAAIDRALERVLAFRRHIDTDERVEACDNNPFGVKVTLRAELDVALDELEQTLEDALA